MSKQISKKEAEKILWTRGNLRWKLRGVQKDIYDKIKLKDQQIYVILSARRLGKSFSLCTLAAEVCLQKPNSIVKYICPKQRMVKTIIKPIMTTIFEDAPEEVKPEFKTNENMYVFPNGSQIQIAGTDNGNHENLRGGSSDLWIVDEAGFADELDYVVKSILSPTTDTTDGIGILASTPSKRPNHKFISEFVEPAVAEGKLIKYTIYDNPMITPEKIKKIEAGYIGGASNPEFRREYLCDIINDESDLVIPEFDTTAEKEIVKDWQRPKFFDYYLSMDIGGKDLTVILIAYLDFINNKIVFEDEIVLKDRQNSTKIANNIKAALIHSFGEKPPYLMFADNNNVILLNDLQLQHGLNFIPTRKDNKEAAVNAVRNKVQNREIIINPRCKTLIYHMKYATWSKSATSNFRQFSRSADAAHYDALDSCIYMIRNMIYGKNPFPAGYQFPSQENGYVRDNVAIGVNKLAEIFKVRKSLKVNK